MTRAARAGLALLLAAVSCAGAEPPEVLAPQGTTPGRRLPWPEATEPVRDWGFAADQEEIALETRGPQGRRSVTVWCAVVDGTLYVATDDSRERKRWVRDLGRDPSARVGIAGKTYPVRARPVRELARWNAVMDAYGRKYGAGLGRYDFPKRGDTASGRVFALESAP